MECAGFKSNRRKTSLSLSLFLDFKRGPTADKIYCTAHFAGGFRETRLPSEPQALSHTEISRNRAKTNEKEEKEEEKKRSFTVRESLSRKLAKEDGESFHLRVASEVGANGGLKSFAIERRRFLPRLLSREESAGSRPAKEQPVDPPPPMQKLFRIYSDLSEISSVAVVCGGHFRESLVLKFNPASLPLETCAICNTDIIII